MNTWEAYNDWGGKSLYTFNSTGPVVPASGTVAAAMVSFNRPFANAIDVFQYEYDRVRWLERNGYDVSYQTDVDTDENPASLLGHRLDVVSGHDEYWSRAMRNAWEAARAAGVNLAFLGGNIGFWQARYAAGDRTLIEYRSAKLDPDPVASAEDGAVLRAARSTGPSASCSASVTRAAWRTPAGPAPLLRGHPGPDREPVGAGHGPARRRDDLRLRGLRVGQRATGVRRPTDHCSPAFRRTPRRRWAARPARTR